MARFDDTLAAIDAALEGPDVISAAARAVVDDIGDPTQRSSEAGTDPEQSPPWSGISLDVAVESLRDVARSGWEAYDATQALADGLAAIGERVLVDSDGVLWHIGYDAGRRVVSEIATMPTGMRSVQVIVDEPFGPFAEFTCYRYAD